ncbi:hypothetical protein ALP71_200005 [Pseudomonas coronafaciens pv. garcae]|nr:hypothetical protein ALP71_200005 [Pseudomonas coronafaciens pv. garcae]
MKDVAVSWPRRGQSLVGKLDTLPKRIVFFHDSCSGRHCNGICCLDLQTFEIDVGCQLIKIGFLGIGQHQ